MKGPILHSSVVPRDEHCDLVPSLQPAVLPTLRTLHPYNVSLEMYPHVVGRERVGGGLLEIGENRTTPATDFYEHLFPIRQTSFVIHTVA